MLGTVPPQQAGPPLTLQMIRVLIRAATRISNGHLGPPTFLVGTTKHHAIACDSGRAHGLEGLVSVGGVLASVRRSGGLPSRGTIAARCLSCSFWGRERRMRHLLAVGAVIVATSTASAQMVAGPTEPVEDLTLGGLVPALHCNAEFTRNAHRPRSGGRAHHARRRRQHGVRGRGEALGRVREIPRYLDRLEGELRAWMQEADIDFEKPQFNG